MLVNSYTGIVEPEIARLIVNRARRLHISANEIDDVQQQIVPKLTEFRFDEERANGAPLMAVITGIIDRQLNAYLRAKRRYEQHIVRLQEMSGSSAGGRAISPNRIAQPEPVDLRIDLKEAMAKLESRDRVICTMLADGHTIKAIAIRLKCDRETVARRIDCIRRVFTAAGLRAWVEPDSCSEPQTAPLPHQS